jgi:DNA polymerase III delta prime subunit
MVTDKLLTEVLRPSCLKFVAMPERVRMQLQPFEGGEIPQNILLYSSTPGTGKTTITKILSKPYIENGCCKVINASKERGIDVIRETILNFASTYSIMGGVQSKKLIVLEEMDGLTRESFDALRAIMEEQANAVRFIGNCNNIAKIPEPIQSRFLCIPMFAINQEEEADLFTQYVELVSIYMKKSGISFTKETLDSFIKIYFPNMRSIINEIQSMTIQGKSELVIGDLAKKCSCEDLLDAAFGGASALDMYKLVMTNYSMTAYDALRSISEEFVDYILNKCPQYEYLIEPLTILTAKYIANANTSVDKTIFLRALLCEISTRLKKDGK